VSGGSRGIGAATARLAGERGYDVAVAYEKDREAAERVAAEVANAGSRALAVRADVAQERDVVHLFDEAAHALAPPCAVLACAGVTGGFSRVEDLSVQTLERVLSVNVIGTILLAREAVRRMSTRRGGRGGSIVTVSSIAAQLGGAGEWVHYAASKGAVETFTVGLAREVASEGIRVNCVSPGLIETGLHAAAGDSDRPRRLAAGIPLGRPGTAAEVAEGVLWLLSSAASYTTGAILRISGGR